VSQASKQAAREPEEALALLSYAAAQDNRFCGMRSQPAAIQGLIQQSLIQRGWIQQKSIQQPLESLDEP